MESERFGFGKNWQDYSRLIDEPRIASAVESLQQRFRDTSLTGKTFLDIGSGSGLFSLAAHRLGAIVTSFDYDSNSVACTQEVKARFASQASNWKVLQGSALDESFLSSLGTFDFVYSWGVLHHTGHMWKALDNAAQRVAPGGQLCIAIYNDQGRPSRLWWKLKHLYNQAPTLLRPAIVVAAGAFIEGKAALGRAMRGKNPLPFKEWAERKRTRGMSVWHDLVDWVGGFPFEVARPDQISGFFGKRGFVLEELQTCGGGLGCNEFVFRLK